MSSDAVKIENVSRIFPNGKCALQNINLNIKQGEFAVVGGRNGSGKSVLMSLIARLDEPTTGKITAPSAGLVFQNADAQILGETPEEDILFGLRNMQLSKDEIKARLEKTLTECGLQEKRNFQARLLSGGEKRRLAVAGILAMERELIIFDEPFTNLDYPGVMQVCKILQELKNNGKTVILLTHELEKILALADSLTILDDGIIKYSGNAESALKSDIEQWGIRNPLQNYDCVEKLFWGRNAQE